MEANAVVFTAPNTVEYSVVECPDPGPDNVVIRLTHSWISNGTEGSYLRGERIAGDTAYRDGDPWPFPIVAGYQRIGVVDWVGAEVADLKVGETVFSVQGAVNGMFEPRGGHISPSVCRREQVWRLPQDREPLAFAGMVLTQVGYNCGSRAAIGAGEAAVVVGDGLVGHWAAQTLAMRGADVLLAGRHDDRLQKAAGRAGIHCVNTREEELDSEIGRQFGAGVQVLIDTVGSVAAIESSYAYMKRNGHVVSAGFYGTADLLALQLPRHLELSIDLVSGWTRERMDATLELIAASRLDTLSLITHHFPVAEAATAWQLIESKAAPVLGVILDW